MYLQRTLKNCLHHYTSLLHGHRVLNLPDLSCAHGTVDIDVSQETLSKRAKYLGKIMEHFLKCWKSEY